MNYTKTSSVAGTSYCRQSHVQISVGIDDRLVDLAKCLIEMGKLSKLQVIRAVRKMNGSLVEAKAAYEIAEQEIENVW